MKRLVALFALLFATSAFAVDNKVPCTGASCKVQLAPHDGSNVQQTVLTADGVNTRVGIGSTTPGATLEVSGAGAAAQITVKDPASGAGAFAGFNLGTGNRTYRIVNDGTSSDQLFIRDVTAADNRVSITSAGAVTFGPSTANVTNLSNGALGFQGSTTNAVYGAISSKRVNGVTSSNTVIGTAANLQGELMVLNTSTSNVCKFMLRAGSAVLVSSDPASVCSVTSASASINVFFATPNYVVNSNSTVNTLLIFTGVNTGNL